MGCGCGGGSRPRAGRALVTSGDLVNTGTQRLGSALPGAAPGGEPLGVFPVDVEHEVPEGSHYKVTTAGEVAYFGAHHDAFRWQREHPGKLRTVR